jgi:hypothetical protein
MPIGETLLAAMVGKAVEKAATTLNELRKESRDNKVSINDSQARTCLISHVQSVDSWAGAITLLTLLRDKQLRESFVELSLQVGLIKYGGTARSSGIVNLDEIIADGRHTVILGRPGAGKTTSLQRVAQIALARWEEGKGGLPILVRLRDLRGEDSLTSHLLATVGLDVRVPTRLSNQMRRAWERRAVITYLGSISAVLLIDGLDEAHFTVRDQVERDLRDLVESPGDHRVFLTCRTAEYTIALSNSQAYTILPLSRSQVSEFARRWLGDKSEAFIEAVAHNPYAGTEVVPLTLAHLCAIYERDGELPPRPIDVYEQIVSLLIEEWDKQRLIIRTSKYSDFSWRKKERFLQAAAYYLTMNERRGSFSEYDLELVYAEIAPEFNLPLDDASDVMKEVESHTGLIQEVGYRQYEFVHLVIQEYLTAMYAHRKANAVSKLMPNYPNEMALVIAYSTSPDEFLEEALNATLKHFPGASAAFVIPFLSRLTAEKPLWRATPRLGWTVLAFMDIIGRHFRTLDQDEQLRLPEEVLSLLDDPEIADAIRYAAAEAEQYVERIADRLIPKPHASLPPALAEFLRSHAEAGLWLIKSERRLHQLLKEKRKRAISARRRNL